MSTEIKLSAEQQETVELLENFFNVNDVVIFDSVTDVKLKGGKKNQNQGKVKRILQDQHARPNIKGLFTQLMNEHLQETYQAALKEGKEVEQPEEFVPSKPRWGTVVGDGVIFHNDQFYVSLLPVGHETTTSTITLSDEPVKDPTTIEGFPEPRPEGSSPVAVRLYNIKNITNLRNSGGDILKVDPESGLVTKVK